MDIEVGHAEANGILIVSESEGSFSFATRIISGKCDCRDLNA